MVAMVLEIGTTINTDNTFISRNCFSHHPATFIKFHVTVHINVVIIALNIDGVHPATGSNLIPEFTAIFMERADIWKTIKL